MSEIRQDRWVCVGCDRTRYYINLAHVYLVTVESDEVVVHWAANLKDADDAIVPDVRYFDLDECDELLKAIGSDQ